MLGCPKREIERLYMHRNTLDHTSLSLSLFIYIYIEKTYLVPQTTMMNPKPLVGKLLFSPNIWFFGLQLQKNSHIVGFLREVQGVQGEGGVPGGSLRIPVWEDWETLGKIRGIATTPEESYQNMLGSRKKSLTKDCLTFGGQSDMKKLANQTAYLVP